MGTTVRAAVVVGVDESEAALAAVRWAAEEAVRRECVLRLFHAGLFDTADLRGGEPSREEPRLLERAHRWLRRAEQVAQEAAPDVRIEYAVRLGPAADLLVGLSDDAALIVLGSHGIGGLRGAAIGSVALRVAASARCPAVIVRGRAKAGGPVVAGVVGDGDDRTLRFAVGAARDRDVPLILVHAWHEGLLNDPELVEAAVEGEERALRRRVDDLVRAEPGVTILPRAIRERSAARALLRFEDAQLLVIGSRGRGAVAGGLFGSTGNRLLAHAMCPVAVVH
ncbi:universal stress protein [Amycolatopsis sp. NPDC049253]|uniref:universal stress protein n=1 Tax=Amycolatopsis sp. NPDC049253 TaxID=3155274 RepID=UPI003439782D